MTVTPTSTALYGHCDNCGQTKRARELTAVCLQERQSSKPQWYLLCGPCFVDGSE